MRLIDSSAFDFDYDKAECRDCRFAEVCKKYKYKNYCPAELAAELAKLITACDVVNRGHWIVEGAKNICSVCNASVYCDGITEIDGTFHLFGKYCPNCGARLEEEVSE